MVNSSNFPQIKIKIKMVGNISSNLLFFSCFFDFFRGKKKKKKKKRDYPWHAIKSQATTLT
jgi:hypothetical protein